MQDSVEKSITDGFNRALGTVMGGALGIAFKYFELMSINVYFAFIVCMLCVSTLIYVCVLINRKSMVAITCIVFLAVAVNPMTADYPVEYAVGRVIDTIVGIVIAVAVNRFFFIPQRMRVKSEKGEGANFSYAFKRADHMPIIDWEGGVFSEIYISPRGAVFDEWNFVWRFAVVSVNRSETRLKKAEGYRRAIMPLESDVRVGIKGMDDTVITRYGNETFDAGRGAVFLGNGRNLHLIFKDGISLEMSEIMSGETFDVDKNGVTAIYSLYDGVKASLSVDGKEVFVGTLNEGDFISFDDLERGTITIDAAEGLASGPAAVRVASLSSIS
jgi:environmental stress-induced protein Ves